MTKNKIITAISWILTAVITFILIIYLPMAAAGFLLGYIFRDNKEKIDNWLNEKND